MTKKYLNTEFTFEPLRLRNGWAESMGAGTSRVGIINYVLCNPCLSELTVFIPTRLEEIEFLLLCCHKRQGKGMSIPDRGASASNGAILVILMQ